MGTLWRTCAIVALFPNYFGQTCFVSTADVCHMTNQPPLSSTVKSHRLSFFWHLARMDENADDSQVMFEPPPESWIRQSGQPRTTWMKTIQGDLSSLDLKLHEARELAQNRPLWRLMSLYSATHSQWCMLLLN